MDIGTVSQIVTIVLAVLAIIWHQQRVTDKLRERLDKMEQRLARIEGFLGIGMPAAADARHRERTWPASLQKTPKRTDP